MSGGSYYECAVAQKKTAAVVLLRLFLLLLYTAVGAACLLLGLRFDLLLLSLEIGALLVWALVLLTWRLTRTEYEYSIVDGELSVFRILGGKSRRRLCTVRVRDMTAIYPCTEEYAARIAATPVRRRLFAASARDAQNLYVAFWNDERRGETALWFEPDERLCTLLRQYNITAVRLKK